MEGSEIDWSKAESVDAIIIGNGPAGCTAGIYLGRAGYAPLLFTGEERGGQLTETDEMRNFPGFSGTGPQLMKKMEEQAVESGAIIREETIAFIDLFAQPFKVQTSKGSLITSKVCIIATGAKPVHLGIESEEKFQGKGISYTATRDANNYVGKDVIVVGGGDCAVEEAIYLSKFAKSVTMIHRSKQLRACRELKQRLGNATVKMQFNCIVSEITGDDKVNGVKCRDITTNQEYFFPAEGVFIAVGHKPATDMFKQFLETNEHGYISTNGTPKTKIPGVYVAGDCADGVYRQAITSCATGCQAALLAEREVLSTH